MFTLTNDSNFNGFRAQEIYLFMLPGCSETIERDPIEIAMAKEIWGEDFGNVAIEIRHDARGYYFYPHFALKRFPTPEALLKAWLGQSED